MKTNDVQPEAELRAVANHDFRRLSPPILVACKDQEQFQEFTFREGLMCSEVRRFPSRRLCIDAYPPGKILILLPSWHEHPRTSEAVNLWVNRDDRYTVALRSPHPLARKRLVWGVVNVCSILFWVAVIAWFFNR